MATVFEKITRAFAVGLGIGFLPVFPGSVASFLFSLTFWYRIVFYVLFVLFSVLGFIGTLFIMRDRNVFDDPSEVVADEITGMGLALMFVPQHVAFWLSGFALFRLLDIWKPWIIKKCERIPGAVGIFADDIAAGLLTNLFLQIMRVVGTFTKS